MEGEDGGATFFMQAGGGRIHLFSSGVPFGRGGTGTTSRVVTSRAATSPETAGIYLQLHYYLVSVT